MDAMGTPAGEFDRFLAATYRRLMILRVLERTGLGVAMGCGAAMILMPILIWRGQSAMPLALVILGIGAAAGLIWGWAWRPTRLSAAMEADRQLDLCDLLGTAMALQEAEAQAGMDPWAAAVRAMAEARCAQLSPSALILNRLGARAWGGIGLATALVLTVAGLAAGPGDTGAQAAPRAFISPADLANPQVLETRTSARNAPPARASRRAGDDPQSQDSSAGSQDNSTAAPNATDPSAGSPKALAADPSGTGGGIGLTRSSVAPRQTTSLDATGSEETGTAGPMSSGGRSANRDVDRAGGQVSGRGATGSPSARGAPWTSAGWPQQQAAVEQAVRSGAIPDAYRDLVREYFDLHD